MAERKQPGSGESALLTEIARQNKVILALMNRAERASGDADGSEFGAFQTTIILQDQVRRRTEELERALRDNEKAVRALRESEAMFRSVVNQPLVGIAIIEDGKFQGVIMTQTPTGCLIVMRRWFLLCVGMMSP